MGLFETQSEYLANNGAHKAFPNGGAEANGSPRGLIENEHNSKL